MLCWFPFTHPANCTAFAKALPILPGSCTVPPRWPEPDIKVVAILDLISQDALAGYIFHSLHNFDIPEPIFSWFCQHGPVLISKPLSFSSSSELLSITASFQPRSLERTDNYSVHFIFREKNYTLTSVSELHISARQQAKSQLELCFKVLFPFGWWKGTTLWMLLWEKGFINWQKEFQYSQFPVLSMETS